MRLTGPMEEFVRKHESRLYRAAIAVMGNRADAEDVVQDVFIKVLEKRPEFESPEHEIAWLLRVTVNLCRNRLRSTWWKKTGPLLDTYPARFEGERELMETILSLPAKYRIVLHLFYYEGYSTREIAEVTDQKESTVRSLLTRARQRLGALLKEEAL
ncbi:MAG TPA: sigma-70 family RNA polymerase sigma factor [Firmicutes bacterium]|nr:sigma-70 family RNA polymerase sigma factor [Candidatus Fermentithermobacillaceae bacterium]